MDHVREQPLSTSDFISAAALIVGIFAVVFDLNWAVRSSLVLLAIMTIIFTGKRHQSKPAVRIPIAMAAIGIFSFFPWNAVWADFHRSYPDVLWPEAITGLKFRCALAVLAILGLVSAPRNFFRGWRNIRFAWRQALGEPTWIDYDTALKVIRASDWAKTREPSASPWIAFISGVNIERDRLQFNHFIKMTLNSFEERNNENVRLICGNKQYSEERLRLFLHHALDADTIKRFGELPI